MATQATTTILDWEAPKDLTVGDPFESSFIGRRHLKTSHHCYTKDRWRLHLVRTQQLDLVGTRNYPLLLVPGLGSSGAYSFDLSPAVSLADYLASKGWDVWTAELRGNGLSDKPAMFTRRSRWWTIDDYVNKDIPALIRYVLKRTRSPYIHILGHSMGGMIITKTLGRNDQVAAKVRSATIVGSGCFLQGSWWQNAESFIWASNLMYTVPAGAGLRLYSRVAFTNISIPALDTLYFWPSNTDPELARTLLAKNFSNISPGVLQQFKTAFRETGLTTFDGCEAYAEPSQLSAVRTPVMIIVGDSDHMCPADGAHRTFQLFGSPDKKFVLLGPENGQRHHYGHFDILMGNHVEQEVFPTLHEWLAKHDGPLSRL